MSSAVGEGAAPAVLVAGALATGISVGAVGAAGVAVAPALALTGGGAGAVAALSVRGRRGWALAAAALLAAALGMLRGGAIPASGGLPIGAGEVVVSGTVRDAPASRGRETLVTVDAERLADAGGDRAVRGGVLAAVTGAPELGAGDRVRLEAAALRRPGERAGAASATALLRDGVAAVAVSPRIDRLAAGPPRPGRLIAAVRTRIAAAVAGALPPVTATLLTEIAFGIHGTLPPDTAAALRDAGLIHLVATSGFKVAIVVGLLTRLAVAAGLGPRRRLLLVGPAVAAYVAVAGGGAAAVRSALMAGAGLALQGSGRRMRPLALLAVTAALLLAVDPGLCTDPGFQLSFLGTLGILLLAAPICARLPGPRWLAEPFAVTCAAEAATVPVMASTFGVLSLVGPVANALVVPAVPLVVVLAWAGAGLAAALPALGWPPLAAAALLVTGIGLLARALAALPLAAVHVAAWPRAWTWALLATAGAGGAVLAAGAGRVRIAAVTAVPAPGRRTPVAVAAAAAATAGVAVLLLLTRPDGRLHVTVLDTGGSAATLVRTGDGATALVDGGSDHSRLLAALGRALPPLTRSLDLVVLTGGDRSTATGLTGLGDAYRIGAVVAPDRALGTGAEDVVAGLRAAGAAVVRVPPGAAWRWHGASWRLLAPPPDTGPLTAALQIGDAGGTALILGALAPPGQEEVAAVEGGSLAADLLVTPARGAVAPALLAAARPRLLAVPSARAPRAAPEESGAALRSTALDGSLDYRGGPAGMAPG